MSSPYRGQKWGQILWTYSYRLLPDVSLTLGPLEEQ